jgi:hypothetical protein
VIGDRAGYNPTPFPWAQDARWQRASDGEWFRPARVYLRAGCAAVAVLMRTYANIVLCESLSSGFGGPLIDEGGAITGFVFGRTTASAARAAELEAEWRRFA